jgi:tripartite-type tricarboxylate transporter receptor subunit TctC
MPTRRSTLALAAATLAAPHVARAAWPADRPIEVIVPFPPGGGQDVMARFTLQHLARHMPGARFVVNNRAGASGQIGIEQGFNAAPDGYTVFTASSIGLSSAPLERPVRWRVPDLTCVGNIVDDACAFWVLPASPYRDLPALAAAMRAQPETIALGSGAGVGSDDHLVILAFEETTGTRSLYAPYNGTQQCLRDLLGGSIAVASFNMSEGISLLREGKLRCLGQASTARWDRAAEVPTFRDQGIDAVVGSTRGFFAPANLPAGILAGWTAAFDSMFADPVFLADAEKLALPLKLVSGEAHRRMVLEEQQVIAALFARRPWGHR